MTIHTEVLEVIPETGTTVYFHWDDRTEEVTIENVQDLELLIEYNKTLRNVTEGRWKGDFHHVAQIPTTVLWDLQQKGILDDPERFTRWLNDRDNQVFRTREGRI